MKKVLILTASFGDGHNAAARGVQEGLESIDPQARVETLDLLQLAYGKLNQMARATYLGLIRHAPGVWQGLYHLIDAAPQVTRGSRWTRLRRALGGILESTEPDCVVSTYPLYGEVIADLFRDHAIRPFRLITVVTDSITVNSAWCQAPSDLFCVANEPTAAVLLNRGLGRSQVAVTGFPVSPRFHLLEETRLEDPVRGRRHLLYIVNSGQKKVGRVIESLLELPGTNLTVTTGRDAGLKAKLTERLAAYGDRVRLYGWTNAMPELMASHHLVITKAGGATVQEAIAARCPLLLNQVLPGQEEGNAVLVRERGYGRVVDGRKDLVRAVGEAFEDGALQWRRWRENLAAESRPGAALRIAQLALDDWEEPRARIPEAPETSRANGDHSSDGNPQGGNGGNGSSGSGGGGAHGEGSLRQRRPMSGFTGLLDRGHSGVRGVAPRRRSEPDRLLCDFHIHSNYSDGRLSVPEIIDFYGGHGFDCICITDHLADQRRMIGKVARLSGLTIHPRQLDEYFAVIRREADRAWRRYRMLVLTGIEFNKDGYTRKSSAHLLGVGLTAPIHSDLDLPETIAEIHGQGALAIASHPHVMKSEWGKNTLYLWENQETFAPLLDAWEIANRDNIFSPVGLKRLPFVANSDFHRPRHIYSWKTILHCDKDAEAIKDCVRRNERVSITLYRREDSSPETVRGPRPCLERLELPSRAAVLPLPGLSSTQV